MKKLLVLSTAFVLSFSAHAADPVVKAECAAIFHGASVVVAEVDPDMAAAARYLKRRMMASAESQIGASLASRYYVNKMNLMTSKVQADRGGNGFDKNELNRCVKIAQSYGMM